MPRFSPRHLLLLPLCVYVFSLFPAQQAFAAPTTFRPSLIPLSDPEIVNPYRGFVKWGSGETVPQPEPAKDWTSRFTWRDIETSQGVYNWSVIDQSLASARAEGRRFAFGLRDMKGEGIAFPDYLKPYAWQTTLTSSGTSIWVPNYNHPFWQERVRALLSAASQRYNGNRDVAWVDIRLFGLYGEWHLYGVDYNRAPSGVTPPTDATKRAIIDAHINAFPSTQLVSMSDDAFALKYALMDVSTSIPIGWRRDSGGNEHWDNGLQSKLDDYPGFRDAVLNRWKTAPVVMEPWNPPDAAIMLRQVQEWHVAMIGNGNFGDAWNSASSSAQANFREAGKRSGYRFAVPQVTLDMPSPGKLAVTAQWQNAGVTPAYEPWQARWQLRRPTDNGVAWEGISQVNLKALLPTNGSPATISDTFSLPNTVAAGKYRLALLIADPRNIRQPLRLAMNGKQSDNSYLLGDISLSSGGLDAPQAPVAAPAPAALPIIPRASTTGGVNEGSELRLAAPSSTNLGDVLLAQVTVYDPDATITPPTGWIEVRADQVSNTMKQLVYYKVAGASEPSSYTWKYNIRSDAAGGIMAYLNVDRANPIAAHSGQVNASTNTITAPSLTTNDAGQMLVFFGSTDWGYANISAPNGMSQRYSQRTDSVGISSTGTDQLLGVAGPTGNRTATAASGNNTIGQLVALRPASGLAPDLIKDRRYLPFVPVASR